ncbi:Os05g0469812 [Oryza sativa Japonica Group]|uniref:Os05g0469812 protein n=1 Tax=Oryza sativa subsp. japonica TaxID=39947 RepID=A0A0P0WNI7_ORYSJ|nr:hypothetical protein EE612_030097 [Oryza sativa]BAS94479.1 Os05g0469812 [Oryza sativa Japonica Group]
MNRGWCSGTRPLADGITANGYPLDSAMPANAFFALATRIFGPPTITGFTALFRKSAAASTACSKFAFSVLPWRDEQRHWLAAKRRVREARQVAAHADVHWLALP